MGNEIASQASCARAIVTGSGGLVGSETVAYLVEAGFDVIGLENDMRSYFFGPEASTRRTDRAAPRAYGDRLPVDRSRDPRRGCGRFALRRASRRARAGRSHGCTAIARLGGVASRRPTSRSTQTGRSTCSRPRAGTARTRRSSSRRRTRSTGIARTRLPLVELETRLELPEDHEYYDGIPTIDADRPVAALALRRVEGRRRPARPGVRPLLRHPHGLLPRGLPHRPQPRGRSAARLPLLPDALHRHRRALHRARLRRQAGAGQPAQRRPRAGVRGLPRRATTLRRSTTSAAGADANCSMLEAIALCEQIAGRDARTGSSRTRRVSATTAGGSATWSEFRRDYPAWEPTYGIEDTLREIYEQNVEAWSPTVSR